MTLPPLVTVVTPSFNQGRFIEETIRSVLSQDYPAIEHLVIDGGSTDGTLEVLRKYEDRLTWISEPDRGQTHAINKGFGRARGEIVCWLNSDDTYEPGAIRKAVDYLTAHPEVMLVYGEGNEIDESGAFLRRFHATQRFDLWALVNIWDYILQPTTFFRKSVFESVDLPDETLHWCMDWDLWIRIGSKFPVGYLDDVLANSRIYPETKTGSGGIKRLREIASVMRKYSRKRYPLGVFIFGEDTLETLTIHKMPWLFRILKPLFFMSRRILTGIQQSHQGYYPDGWLAPRAHFLLPRNHAVDFLGIEMEVPGQLSLPLKLEISIDRSRRSSHSISRHGVAHLEIPLRSPGAHPVDVTLHFSAFFSPPNDPRRVTVLLRNIRLGNIERKSEPGTGEFPGRR